MARIRSRAPFAVTLVFVAGCASPAGRSRPTTAPAPIAPEGERAADSPSSDLAAALTGQMQINRRRYGIAGQALMVTHDGEVLFRGADGEADLEAHEPMTPDHVFPMHSVSKLLVSTLVMQLAEQGTVNLDAPASRYVSELPASWSGITVRQFLNHTSGVPEYFDTISSRTVFPPTRQAMLSSLAARPLLFEPGTAIRYTNTNYVVLAALLEAHYGEPYPKIVEARIFKKLHLEHSWLGKGALPASGVARAYSGEKGQLRELDDATWPVYAYGQTALYSTLDDLTRFLQAMSRGELVGKASLEQFWQPRRLPDGQRIWAATGWDVGESDGYREVGHDGGTHVRVRILFKGTLDGDVYTVAYLTNGSARNVWSGILVDSAMARVAPSKFPAEVVTERLRAFALEGAVGDAAAAAEARAVQEGAGMDAVALERLINETGYAARENLGVEAAIRVFEVGTRVSPQSVKAWDSLAEAYEGEGDAAKAAESRDHARHLAAP